MSAKFFATIASGASALVIIGSLICVGVIFQDINNLYDDVMDDMQEFRMLANQAWKEMVIPSSGSSDSARSVFGREKRAASCNCGAQPNNCPAGPPGPPGKPGSAGEDGENGEAGRPGVNGIAMFNPKAGANGQPGAPGQSGAQGPAGPAGQNGQAGAPGTPGVSGGPGLPGNDAAYCPCPPRTAAIEHVPASQQYRRRFNKI
ncbi:unnamed protein product [Nippostrongylus brasiliensis]|uniref:Col_cuticle_N domain-containing protein n=1 Tax=Nippostrongylus brasiliensis TaxID=27835 RepID=A0A0N4Y7L1_NIPBR|nr:unnamed protein product [Nippostrongylus brasiliensis]